MIERELARKLVALVNDLDAMSLLRQYIDARIKVVNYNFRSASDMESIYRLQGALQELERLQTLRDEVIEDSK